VSAVFENPYPVGDQLHWLSGSVGVSRAPEHGHNFTELLEYADNAMYRVKRARKSPEHARTH
jgi:GGDEF domain-containing protein